jgi:8-oxo-dGTP pyrophosphatase MutT (NUDIX family)
MDSVPLDAVPFDGVPGVAPDKLPGSPAYARAPIDPDEPRFPQLERPVPGTDVIASPDSAPAAAAVAKDATAGVTSGTGLAGSPLAAVVETKPAEEYEDVAKATEVAAFRRFVAGRRKAGRWRDFQFEAVDAVAAHRLNDAGRAEVRKAEGLVIAAGLAVRAADTGRVLMLQRAFDPADAAGGMWEFPGGHVEDGESPMDAAVREWCEETGCALPEGECTGTWASVNGVYRGFVWTIPGEAQIDLGDRTHFVNPDDPDGDCVETLAWWAPGLLEGNPAVRRELAASLPAVLESLSTSSQPAAGAEGVCPCGTPAVFDDSDGWQHADGSISHDGEFYGWSVSGLMETVAKAGDGSGPKA